MRASPYDLTDFGLEPVRVETEDGKREYRLRQRVLAERARVLRERLIGALEHVIAVAVDPFVQVEP